MNELIEVKYIYCHECGSAKAPHEVEGEDTAFLLLTALRHARDTGHTMGINMIAHEKGVKDEDVCVSREVG